MLKLDTLYHYLFKIKKNNEMFDLSQRKNALKLMLVITYINFWNCVIKVFITHCLFLTNQNSYLITLKITKKILICLDPSNFIKV